MNLKFSFLEILVKMVDWTKQKDNELTTEEKEKIQYHAGKILQILPKPNKITGKVKGTLPMSIFKQGQN